MSEREGHWITARSLRGLMAAIYELDYLWDVRYEIIEKCPCGRLKAFVHYIV